MKKLLNGKNLIMIAIIDFLLSSILYLVYIFTGNQYQPILYTFYVLNVLFFIVVLAAGIDLIIKDDIVKKRNCKEKKK